MGRKLSVKSGYLSRLKNTMLYKNISLLIFLLYLSPIAAPYSPELDSLIKFSNKNSRPSTNHIIYELLGTGGLASVSYEKTIKEFPSSQSLFIRGGLGIPLYGDNEWLSLWTFPIPVSAGYMVGNKHKLEVSLGADFVGFSGSGLMQGIHLGILPMAGVGYRLTPNKSKDNFRVGLSCIVYPYYEVQIVPWPYISYGVSF